LLSFKAAKQESCEKFEDGINPPSPPQAGNYLLGWKKD